MWPVAPYWVQQFHRQLQVTVDLGHFPLPMDAGDFSPVLVSGTAMVLLSDRPEARSLMGGVTGLDHGVQLARDGSSSTVAANMRLDPSEYLDPRIEQIAWQVRRAAVGDALRLGFLEQVPDLADIYLDILPRWFDAGPDADVASFLAEVEAAWLELDALNAEG